MFHDTESAILPRSPEDRWGSLVFAFGFHGAVGVTLLLAAVLVVRPVTIVEPPVDLEIVIPVELPPSGAPPRPVPARPAARPDAGPSVALAVPDTVPPIVEETAVSPSPHSWDEVGLDLGPGLAEGGIGHGVRDGSGPGDGFDQGGGTGPGQGEPVELSGTIEPPSLLVRVEPAYPHVARAAGIQGRVVLRAVVGTDGSVERVEVIASPHPLLADAAEEAVLRWRYRPAVWRERAVRVWFTVRVDFVLR